MILQLLLALTILLATWAILAIRYLGRKLREEQAATKAAYAKALGFVLKQMKPSGLHMVAGGMRAPIFQPFALFLPESACEITGYEIVKGDEVKGSGKLQTVSMVAGDTLYMQVGLDMEKWQ